MELVIMTPSDILNNWEKLKLRVSTPVLPTEAQARRLAQCDSDMNNPRFGALMPHTMSKFNAPQKQIIEDYARARSGVSKWSRRDQTGRVYPAEIHEILDAHQADQIECFEASFGPSDRDYGMFTRIGLFGKNGAAQNVHVDVPVDTRPASLTRLISRPTYAMHDYELAADFRLNAVASGEPNNATKGLLAIGGLRPLALDCSHMLLSGTTNGTPHAAGPERRDANGTIIREPSALALVYSY